LEVTIADIEKYIEDVKEAINADRYRVEMNDSRQDNQDLFMDVRPVSPHKLTKGEGCN